MGAYPHPFYILILLYNPQPTTMSVSELIWRTMDYYELLYLLTREREPQPQHTTQPYTSPKEWEKRRKTNDR